MLAISEWHTSHYLSIFLVVIVSKTARTAVSNIFVIGIELVWVVRTIIFLLSRGFVRVATEVAFRFLWKETGSFEPSSYFVDGISLFALRRPND